MPNLLSSVLSLCTESSAGMARRLAETTRGSIIQACMMIVVGCLLYGFSIGLWRAPLMGAYVAIKLPLLIFLTVGANGLINGMLAQILDSKLSFRQTLQAILQSFALFAVIVGSLSPVAAWMTLNMTSAATDGAEQSYAALMVIHTGVIAFAGITANLRLFATLVETTRSHAKASRVLFAWLAGNLFLGAQFSYLLRPFFGKPNLDIQFLRPDAFVGNFYSTLWEYIKTLFGIHQSTYLGIGIFLMVTFILCTKKLTSNHTSK